MDKSNRLLSELVTFRTYAKHLPTLGRREMYDETIARSMNMHLERFPKLSRDIVKSFEKVFDYKVCPSMRALQFGGEPLLKNNVRGYNCAFMHLDSVDSFGEMLFLLLSGTGVGFSIQKRHVNRLPIIQQPREEGVFWVPDSIEGWAEALDTLMRAYFYGRTRPQYNFSQIRDKGSYLSNTGAKAPGPLPLKKMLEDVEVMLKAAVGRRLKPIECHDISCRTADCVLAGGIRRAALISLFDAVDEEMLEAKHGSWWEKHPYRARANNSAVLKRDSVTKEQFKYIYDKCISSQCGEPAFVWTNDVDMGMNPCKYANSSILTPEGICRFGDISIGDTVWSGKQWTKVINKWSTGVKPVYKYKTTAGFVECTENHRVVSGGVKVQVSEASSIDVARCKAPSNTMLSPIDVLDGLVIGDGTIQDRERGEGAFVYLLIGDKDQDYFSSEISPYILSSKSQAWGNCRYRILGKTIKPSELPVTYERSIPDRFRYGTPSKVCGLLRGLFTANGSVIKKRRVNLKQTSYSVIEITQEMLSSIGISSYITTNKPSTIKWANGTYTSKQSYDLNITRKDSLYRFRKLVGFIQNYKNSDLDELLLGIREDHITLGGKNSFDIIDVEYIGHHEVFDMTVEAEEHTYWTSGLLVSNCAEIALSNSSFCNLTSVNQTGIKDKKDWLNRVYAASMIGTLQASYTSWPYLRPQWKETTELDALLGVSCTGICDAGGIVTPEWLREGAQLAVEINEKYAKKIGINTAARVLTVKPEGSASCTVGSSSGIHARHSEYYLRRIRINKNDALAMYLLKSIPELIEDDVTSASSIVVTIPQKSPPGAITREMETAKSLFERDLMYQDNWINPGHRYGNNKHNVSVTISYRDSEVEELFELMWENRDRYTAISLLPYSDHTYQQAPFEDCTKEEFDRLNAMVQDVDFSQVIEFDDNTDRSAIVACQGGFCEVI